MQPNDDPMSDPNDNGFFSFPVEPDEEEAILSFDKLREAFAHLNDETDAAGKPDIMAGFGRLDENPQAESPIDAATDHGAETIAETVAQDDSLDVFDETASENDPAEDGETFEPIDASEEERCELSPRTIFEAMLFVGDRDNKPLAPERASELMRNVSSDELVEIVHELNAEYAQNEAPYHIIREGDGYRMVLRPEFEPVRSRFYSKTRETKLSQAAIDVLAIVAYKQPVTADDVQKIRKASSQSILQQLVRRGLIDTQKMIREKKTVTLYRTTDRFLQLFQIESLDDLPMVEDIDFR